MEIIILSLSILGSIGIIAAVILYFAAKKFHVKENPRISEIENVLPAANCGGCGFAGCRNFAEACASASSLKELNCPVGGSEVMQIVADIMGMQAGIELPKVAVLKCNGDCNARAKQNYYDGVKSCKIAEQTSTGESACSYGCLGFGDCANVCNFGALTISKETGLPIIDEDKCTACGACVTACPKNIIELRNKGPKNRRIYVLCSNKDKGGIARKACSNACIGCGKCVKECPFGAITLENNIAYIDYKICKLCRKCVAVCPTGAIHEINFPPRKVIDTTKLKSAEGVKPIQNN